jgi:hypothetical protein
VLLVASPLKKKSQSLTKDENRGVLEEYPRNCVVLLLTTRAACALRAEDGVVVVREIAHEFVHHCNAADVDDLLERRVFGAAERAGPGKPHLDIAVHRAVKEDALLRHARDLLARPRLVEEQKCLLVEQD